MSSTIGNRLVKNVFYMFSAEIAGKVFVLVALIYIARTLGSAAFGKINFALAFASFFVLFASFGLDTMGTRQIAYNRQDALSYVGRIIPLRVLFAIISLILLVFVVSLINKPPDIKYLIILSGFLLIPSAFLLEWVFQGIERMEFIVLSRLLRDSLYFFLILTLIRNSKDLFWVPGAQLIGYFIGAFFLVTVFVRRFGLPKFQWGLKSWQNMMIVSAPFGLATFMVHIFNSLDTVVLGFIRTNREVGYYNAAYQVIGAFILAIAVFYNAIFPVLSDYYKNHRQKFERIFRNTLKFTSSIAIPLGVGGTILAKPTINLLFGPHYEPATTTFQILIWVAALLCIDTAYTFGLLSSGREGDNFKSVAFQAGLTVVFIAILIPYYGLVGAALATLLAEIGGGIVRLFKFSKITQEFNFAPYLLRPALASAVMALALIFLIKANLIILIFLGGFVYLLVLYLLRGITREELKEIKLAMLQARHPDSRTGS